MANSTEKEIKNQFKKEAQKNPSKHYPIAVLKRKGFIRKQCIVCKTYFWTANAEDNVCGDAECRGKYSFINEKTIKPIEYLDVWKKFSAFFKKKNYTPIGSYPVVARWRDDMDFTIASIADFQPYVVAGEIEPPVNPLVIPQFCMRFSDIDNVGITGRHYTGFTMIGQHAFEKEKNYRQEDYFCDLFDWFIDIGFKKEDLIIHEDSWVGGGNMGPSVEFFSGGLELANQVYMKYDISSGTPRKLDINVLDMGLGQERIAWYGNNQNASYEAVFEKAIRHLKSKGLFDKTKEEKDIISSFLPYSGIFDFDENQNSPLLWGKIAGKIGVDKTMLKDTVLKSSALYSILDHSRTILMALSDGALFSNTGGGYNLRVLFRRAQTLTEKYRYDIDFLSIMENHRAYLKQQYPVLKQTSDEIEEIIKNEQEKYKVQKSKTREIISQLKKKYRDREIEENELLVLYQSKGIDLGELEKNKLIKSVPQDFYSNISHIHEAEKSKKPAFDFADLTKNISPTVKTYEFDWTSTEAVCKVLKSKDNLLICDKTCFYATSGGQEKDKGALCDEKKNKIANIVDVINARGVTVHKLDKKLNLKPNQKVYLKADKSRRTAIAFNHTSTHIINAAARAILGNHIWQCGAYKDNVKARLDITHYMLLTKEQLQKIEDFANQIIEEDIPVKIYSMMRNAAEKKYGFRIYQGGAVPQKKLRIIKIGNIDVEACGGTHVDRTGRLKLIKIIEQKKIQDGVVRLIFTSGNSALNYLRQQEDILTECCGILNVEKEHLPRTVKRFFEEWKKQRKDIKKMKKHIGK
ncbi:MAG: alanine--tRNA ligase [Candidatus Nanohalarchaeota archaeon]|nr:MAG: alanine--tRNA ligase [Candidatus Nanohaloarchaeota archaeon]